LEKLIIHWPEPDKTVVESEDMIIFDNDMENEEDGDTELVVLNSKWIGNVNFASFWWTTNCGVLAGKLVRTWHQLHPIILDFLYNPCFKNDYPLEWPMMISFLQNTEERTSYCTHPDYKYFGDWYD